MLMTGVSTVLLHDVVCSPTPTVCMMVSISIGRGFSSITTIMAMVTKYLLANVKEELEKTNELLEETLQISRDVISRINNIKEELKDNQLKVQLEKKELEEKIIRIAVENEELESKVNVENTQLQEIDDLKVLNKKQTEIIEEMKKKMEKYEFILNIEKYRKYEM